MESVAGKLCPNFMKEKCQGCVVEPIHTHTGTSLADSRSTMWTVSVFKSLVSEVMSMIGKQNCFGPHAAPP